MNPFIASLPPGGLLLIAALVLWRWGWRQAMLAGLGWVAALCVLPPVEWLMHAAPEGDPDQAEQAAAFGFSYESETPDMRPGPANQALWEYMRSLPGLRLFGPLPLGVYHPNRPCG